MPKKLTMIELIDLYDKTHYLDRVVDPDIKIAEVSVVVRQHYPDATDREIKDAYLKMILQSAERTINRALNRAARS